MNSKEVSQLRAFLKDNGFPNLGNGELFKLVNEIRASNNTLSFHSCGTLRFEALRNAGTFEFSTWESKRVESSGLKWIAYDELSYLYHNGTVVTKDGVQVKQKDWKKTEYSTTTAERVHKQRTIDAYVHALKNMGRKPIAGETVQIQLMGEDDEVLVPS